MGTGRDADEGRRCPAGCLGGLRGSHRLSRRPAWPARRRGARHPLPPGWPSPAVPPALAGSRVGSRAAGCTCDAGAVTALIERGSSLLPAGITSVEGDFSAGDPVELVDPSGKPIGRGLVGYDAAELPAMLGRSTTDLGPGYTREVVHRDYLVILRR